LNGQQLPELLEAGFNGLLSDRALSLEELAVRWELERLKLDLVEGIRFRVYDPDAEQGVPDNLIGEGVVQRYRAFRSADLGSGPGLLLPCVRRSQRP
jgi:hypothetical protein